MKLDLSFFSKKEKRNGGKIGIKNGKIYKICLSSSRFEKEPIISR